jgi:branched-chain amino acid transport system permease protein
MIEKTPEPSVTSTGSPFRAQILSLVALATVLGVLPFLGINSQFMQICTLAFLWSIAAIGLGLLFGEAGQMSVANGALFGVGAYVAAIGAREQVLSMWTALPVAAVTAAFAATIIGAVALRVRGHYFLIITFAFAELWRISTVNLRELTGGNQGIMVLDPVVLPGVGEIDSLRQLFYLALVAVIAASLIVAWLRSSPFGRNLRVVRENERLAISLGLNAARMRLTAFAISGALAGGAGVLYAYNLKHVGPEQFGASAGIQIVLILLIGGARSAAGPVIGALVFFLLPLVSRLDPITTEILYGLGLLAIVLLSPQGLVPLFASWVKRAWRKKKPSILSTTS